MFFFSFFPFGVESTNNQMDLIWICQKSKISVAKDDHLMPFGHHSMKCNSQHAVHAKIYFLLIQSNLPVIRVKKKIQVLCGMYLSCYYELWVEVWIFILSEFCSSESGS